LARKFIVGVALHLGKRQRQNTPVGVYPYSNGHGEAVDSMWTTQWKGKRLASGEFCLESPTLQSLFNQGIPDNLFEQKKVTFHLERPANTSTQ
jgi:hypothetical protein